MDTNDWCIKVYYSQKVIITGTGILHIVQFHLIGQNVKLEGAYGVLHSNTSQVML